MLENYAAVSGRTQGDRRRAKYPVVAVIVGDVLCGTLARLARDVRQGSRELRRGTQTRPPNVTHAIRTILWLTSKFTTSRLQPIASPRLTYQFAASAVSCITLGASHRPSYPVEAQVDRGHQTDGLRDVGQHAAEAGLANRKDGDGIK